MRKIPAVAYCRVSTKSTDQKRSYDAQIDFFREKADELGYHLVKGIGTFGDGIFADEGLSGKSLLKRHEFNKMIEETKHQEFEAILVTNASRFTRNAEDGIREIRTVKKNNAYVHFIKENLKSCNHSDEFLIDFFMMFAQNELREMSKKIQDGIRKAQHKGKWTSQTPYGYNRTDGYLSINEDESKVVKDIFNKYINGMSLNKIAKILNDSDILSKKSKKWDGTGIRNILKNQIYTGLQIGHRVEMKDIFINKIEKVDKEDLIKHQKDELKIINKEIFDQAQEILKERSNMFDQGKRYSTENKLSNLFYCGNCGSTMKRFERTDNHKPFYLCRNHHNKKGCNYSNYAREDNTLEYIINEIKNFEFSWETPDLCDPEGYSYLGLESIKEIYEQYIIDNLDDDLIDDLPSIKEKIAKLENRKNNLINMRADGEITKEEYLQRRKQIEEELEPLLKERKKINNLNQEREKVWSIYEKFCKYIKEFDFDNIDNIALRKIIKKITIKTEGEERKISIDWNNGLDKGFDKIIQDYIDNKLIDTYGQEDFIEIYDFDK